MNFCIYQYIHVVCASDGATCCTPSSVRSAIAYKHTIRNCSMLPPNDTSRRLHTHGICMLYVCICAQCIRIGYTLEEHGCMRGVCLCQLAARKQVGNAMKPYQKAALTCVMKKNVVFSLNQNDNTAAAAAHECIFPNYRRKTEQFIRLTQIRCCCCWHPCNRDDASRNTRVAKAHYPTACQPHTTPFLGGCDRAGFFCIVSLAGFFFIICSCKKSFHYYDIIVFVDGYL